jgi:glutamate-1-semialdehyde 2,1-aminomutase
VAITRASIDRDFERLDAIIEEEERELLRRQPRSAELARTAGSSLAGGVTSNWQISRPQPIWLSHGTGSKVYDVDGNEYVDLHGGYGVVAVGHGHPAIVEAVSERVRRGTHFAQPTEDALEVSRNLAGRFGLPLWRFANSGTEATMDAVHLMRAATKRPKLVKVEGCYHGHHDSVQVSVYQPLEQLGPASHPSSVQASSGIPKAITDLTLIVPYNDPAQLERLFAEHPGEIAGMILEPVMMNAGIIPPVPGYLAAVRDIVHAHGGLLAFDEVKTGLTVGPGGATALFGVRPDIVCLAKAIGGGISTAAIGGTAEVMDLIATGDYEQVGTFNGNPLAMAAARATLTKVLIDEAYERFARLRERMVRGCEEIIERFRIPAHVVAFGAKGCIVFSPDPVRNYREFLEVDDRYSDAHWLYQMNRGVFLPLSGKAEQWMLSVQHTEEDADRFVENFRLFAEALRS